MKQSAKVRPPHPIPYQGSKRLLAPRILGEVGGRTFPRLIEPFAGSAAISIAAMQRGIVREVVLGESLVPLAKLWSLMVEEPETVIEEYTRLWEGQTESNPHYFNEIRSSYNESRDPVQLLYLLTRCVKNAPRFNSRGHFTQSHDKRRLGMRPVKMRQEITGVADLMKGKTTVVSADFEETLEVATSEDLVYMDPPWEGTTVGRDKRYHSGLERSRLETALIRLVERGIPFILSYDGTLGGRTYGEPLLPDLGMTHIELLAGRSSQATLNGRVEHTVESLYLSPGLAKSPTLEVSQVGLFD